MIRGQRGNSIAEFAMVLPFAAMAVFTVVEASLMGFRSVAAQHGAFRAARVAEVYQGEFADAEFYAMLHPAVFRGGISRPSEAGRDEMAVEALSRPIARLRALSPAEMIRRVSPQGRALPAGLSNEILRGGDTPSPYCAAEGGYYACGYPR